MNSLLSLFHRKKANREFITIVSGLPRSGTSMMMNILDAGGIEPLTDNFRKADDDNPKGYYEFEPVKKLKDGDNSWLIEAKGRAVKVIATLLPHLPSNHKYKVIFLHRAMPEILASQRKMLIHRGEDPDKISDEQLTKLFEKHLIQVDEWLEKQPNLTRLDVSYNRLLEDPHPDIMRINTYLDGSLDVESMIEVIDPNLYRQRKGDR